MPGNLPSTDIGNSTDASPPSFVATTVSMKSPGLEYV